MKVLGRLLMYSEKDNYDIFLIYFLQELSRMIRNAREENARRGGWVRVFPTAETWPAYGSMLEFSSPNNQILHEHLFPESARKHASRNTSTTVNNSTLDISNENLSSSVFFSNTL